MKRPSKSVLLITLALYFATWVGGGLVYSRDMHRRAADQHAHVLALDKKLSSKSKEMAEMVGKRPGVSAEGPQALFHWCIPILPGVLIVSSEYSIGPLWGDGGIRIVVFYGWGTFESPVLIGWVS